MAKQELYFSVDVEADGPIPGPNSMLSFGCVALDAEGEEQGRFEANLVELDGAKPDPETAEWWKTQPEAWEVCRKNQIGSDKAMPDFVRWVDEQAKAADAMPVMVCMPAGFDFLFMYWYMMRFAGRSPFSFSCVDVRTYVMAMRKVGYKRTSKRFWPMRWFPQNMPHTHVAIDDAAEQGQMFINMLRENCGEE